MIKTLITALFSLVVTKTLAEYRVYQYYVKAKNPYAIDQKAYMITSTLNPTSYQAYHGGPESLSIDLLRSWMCFGSTAKKMVCDPPLENFNNIPKREN